MQEWEVQLNLLLEPNNKFTWKEDPVIKKYRIVVLVDIVLISSLDTRYIKTGTKKGRVLSGPIVEYRIF